MLYVLMIIEDLKTLRALGLWPSWSLAGPSVYSWITRMAAPSRR